MPGKDTSVDLGDGGDSHGIEHPAVAAWTRVSGHVGMPERVDVLKDTDRTKIYRLVRAGPGGSNVIAKQRASGSLAEEQVIHLAVHPRLAARTLKCYGFDEPDGATPCTLFLEDAGDEPYDGSDPTHRALAGGWLAAFHTVAAGTPLGAEANALAERGSAYYLAELQAGRGVIEENLHTHPAELAETLREVLSCLDRVEGSWHKVAQMVAPAPRTLVHADLKPNNVRLLAEDGAHDPAVLVLDWEYAGWGPPAVDLAQPPPGSEGLALGVDLDSYAAAVAGAWPELGRGAIDELAFAGTVFRASVAVSWAAASLKYSGTERHVRSVAMHSATLNRLSDEAGWGS